MHPLRLLRELLRATPFRWALLVAAAFAVCTLVLFGFFYWQTCMYVTANIDGAIMEEASLIAGDPPNEGHHEVLEAIAQRLRDDPRRIKLAGLFAPNSERIAGNVEALPAGLPLDGSAHATSLMRITAGDREPQTVRAVGIRLTSGDVLLIGRDAQEVRWTAAIVGRALALGLLPATCLALLAGAWLSLRAKRRIEVMRRQASRIVSGGLQERLPIRRTRDPLDRLGAIVNRMLDEIEALVRALAGVGEDIAHDIRTPLTRVRATLERGRDQARTLGELQALNDRAIAGLDQSLAIVTALLRISEIDNEQRLTALAPVKLTEIVQEVGELYDPIAEDKGVTLRVETADRTPVIGDRDLLFEAVANLVDNAVKFTPAGGAVRISLLPGGDGPIIRVADTGPGIDPADREAVTRRFYRADKSRGTQGVGLGLSLVAAIVKRHDFTLVISVGPGCVVDLACRAARVASTRAIGSPPLAVSLPLGGSVHLGMSSPAGASVSAEVSVPLRARHLPVQ
jgi:signal transduction histidine kinase